MESKCGVFTRYFEGAMARSRVEALEDGTFVGMIEGFVGLLSYSVTESEALGELRDVLEEWVLLGLKLGHPLPRVGEIDLSEEPVLEPVDAY